jgi:hypothetical protein
VVDVVELVVEVVVVRKTAVVDVAAEVLPLPFDNTAPAPIAAAITITIAIIEACTRVMAVVDGTVDTMSLRYLACYIIPRS